MWEITLQQNGKDNEAEFCPEGKYDKERKIKKGYRYSTRSMYGSPCGICYEKRNCAWKSDRCRYNKKRIMVYIL